MEISFNIESELFIELTLLWFTLPFVNVHDVPLLSDLTIFVLDFNISILTINVALNLNYLSSLVGDIDVLVSEHLPPS